MNQTAQIVLTNASQAIPIELIQQTNWAQFTISLVITSLFTFYFLWTLFGKYIRNFKVYATLYKIKKETGRSTFLLCQNMSGMFGGQMIENNVLNEFQRFLTKSKGKDVNIVLQSPGGSVFHAMYISNLLKSYIGKVHMFVPQYSMSGGSLLALSGDSLYMNKSAVIGRIDPQIGDMFNFGSTVAWDQVVKKKGSKAADKSIIYHKMGKQIEKSIYTHIVGLTGNKKLSKFLVKDDLEHCFQINRAFLMDKYGLDIKLINPKLDQKLRELVTHQSEQDTFYVTLTKSELRKQN